MKPLRGQWHCHGNLEAFNPHKETVITLQKRTAIFRLACGRLPVTHKLQSVCFVPDAMEDFSQEHLIFLTIHKWDFKLVSSSRLELDRAWDVPIPMIFWAIENCENIGRAYVYRFLDCGLDETQQIQMGNPAEIFSKGSYADKDKGKANVFQDRDLGYCWREENDGVAVSELFYLETTTRKKGFIEYGSHEWVTSEQDDWQVSINNLEAVFYFDVKFGWKEYMSH